MNKRKLWACIIRLLLLSVVLTGCGSDRIINKSNNIPVAVISGPENVQVGEYVTLEAQGYDSDEEDSLYCIWQLVEKPEGSKLTISPYKDTQVFTIDQPGVYTFSLVLTDDIAYSKPALATIIADGEAAEDRPQIGVTINYDQEVVPLGETVTLMAVTNYMNPEYQWIFRSRPAGSTATLSATDTQQVSFTTDVKGEYSIGVIASNGEITTTQSIVTLEAKNTISDIQEEVVGTGVTIQWTTNAQTLTRIEYGLTEEYGNVLELDAQYRREHSVTLAELLPLTNYYYRISTVDQDGRSLTSYGRTFDTDIQMFELSEDVSRVVYDRVNHQMYAISASYTSTQNLLKVDLATLEETVVSLTAQPIGLVLAAERQAGAGSILVMDETGLLEERSLDTLDVLTSYNVPLTTDLGTFNMKYQNSGVVYLIDGGSGYSTLRLRRLLLDSSTVEDLTIEIPGVYDLAVPTATDTLYVIQKQQYNPDRIAKYQFTTNWAEVDVTSYYPGTYGTPLFINETQGLLVSNYSLLDATNLSHTYYTFSEQINLLNDAGTVAVGEDYIYSLTDYRVLCKTPGGVPKFIDKDGYLYIVSIDSVKYFNLNRFVEGGL